jgi:uncharacterized membrane protein
MPMGPVQLLVVGFDDPEFKGDILAELGRLRDTDVVRLVDLLVVRKDEDGKVEHVQRSDLTADEAEELGATVGALIEHRWAIGLRDAIREAGGFHVADAWVHPADLVAVGLLAAEEAAAR